MVIEIRFNLQIYVQCAGDAITNITFDIQWSLKANLPFAAHLIIKG